MITPTTSEPIDQRSIVTTHIYQVAEKLEAYSVFPYDPMSPPMYERGMITRRIFEKLVDMLKFGDYNRSSSREGRPEADQDAVLGHRTPKGAKASPAGPATNPGIVDARRSAMKCIINELRDFLDHHGAQQDGFKAAKGNAPVRRLDARIATIRSQPAFVPGVYEVLFLAKDKSRLSASNGASPKELVIRTPLTPQEEVVRFIPSRDICYGFAFSISCNPKRRPFVHEHILLGYCRHAERQRWEVSPPSGRAGDVQAGRARDRRPATPGHGCECRR